MTLLLEVKEKKYKEEEDTDLKKARKKDILSLTGSLTASRDETLKKDQKKDLETKEKTYKEEKEPI